jgi:acyl-homoserine lactone acylase PvdQ
MSDHRGSNVPELQTMAFIGRAYAALDPRAIGKVEGKVQQLGGSRRAKQNGHALLANDPHLGLRHRLFGTFARLQAPDAEGVWT